VYTDRDKSLFLSRKATVVTHQFRLNYLLDIFSYGPLTHKSDVAVKGIPRHDQEPQPAYSAFFMHGTPLKQTTQSMDSSCLRKKMAWVQIN
jgi:hypothetical protein